jgi:hypothetical protein
VDLQVDTNILEKHNGSDFYLVNVPEHMETRDVCVTTNTANMNSCFISV